MHDLEHVLFLATAVLFWAQVWDSPPLRARLSPFGRVVYVTAATLPSWLLAVILAMASTPLYPAYAADAGRPWGMSALTDQQLAAGMMWGPGAIPFSVAVFVGIYRWLQTEGQAAAPAARSRRREEVMSMLAASSDVTAGAWMTLVIPVALVVVMIAWGWMLRRRAE